MFLMQYHKACNLAKINAQWFFTVITQLVLCVNILASEIPLLILTAVNPPAPLGLGVLPLQGVATSALVVASLTSSESLS